MTEVKHTPTPWFVSGVRFKMNGSEWHSIARYDEAKKCDENFACVSYDPRTGVGFEDAHFIVRAVNSHEAMLEALYAARLFIVNGVELGYINVPYATSDPETRTLPLINKAISAAKGDA